jgi:hypothetical protein
MPAARLKYSVQVIAKDGRPSPRGGAGKKFDAIDKAEALGRSTHLEVRVWRTSEARCIYTIPAGEASHVG